MNGTAIPPIRRVSNAWWKIAYMHHPMYSSGKKHGSERVLQRALEPLFVEHGVHAVFAKGFDNDQSFTLVEILITRREIAATGPYE